MPINPLDDTNSSDDTDNQDQLNQDKKNTISDGSSVNVSGSTGQTVTGGVSSGTPAPSQQTPTSSGSFVNLNKYIDANADQGAGLGGKVAQTVQSSANQGLSDLGQSAKEYSTDVQSAGVNPSDYTAQNVYSTVQKDLQNPSAVSQDDINNFTTVASKANALTNNTDTAPKALSDLNSYQTADSELTQAQQNAQLTNSESGRNTLLQQAYNSPNYSQGETSLDQLLTQTLPENRQRFSDLRNNLLGQYGLSDQETQAVQNAAQQRTDITNQAQQANQNIQNVLFGNVDANGNLIAPNVDANGNAIILDSNGNPISIPSAPLVDANGNPLPAVSSTDTSNQAALNALNSGQISPIQYGLLTQYQSQLQALPGQLNQQQATNYNTDLQKLIQYYQGNPTYGTTPTALAQSALANNPTLGGATIANSLTQDDLAKLQVLNKLAGRDPNMLGSTVLGNLDTNTFSPDITINGATAQSQLQSAQNVASADEATLAGNAFNQNFTLNGQQINGLPGINSIINNTTSIKDLRGANTAANQSWGAYQVLNNQLNAINSWRQTQGLQPVSINPTLVNSYYKQYASIQPRGPMGNNNTLYNVLNTNTDVVNQPIDWNTGSNNRDIAQANDMKNAYIAAAQLAALRDAISGLQNTGSNLGVDAPGLPTIS